MYHASTCLTDEITTTTAVVMIIDNDDVSFFRHFKNSFTVHVWCNHIIFSKCVQLKNSKII